MKEQADTAKPPKKHVVNKANMDQPQEEFIDDTSSARAPQPPPSKVHERKPKQEPAAAPD